MAGHGVLPFFFTQCKSLVPSPVYAIQVNSGGFFANFLTSLTDDVTSEIAADTVMSNNATVCDLYHPNRIITWLSLVPFYHLKNFISHVNFKLRHSVQIFTVCVNGLIYFTQEIHNCFLEILSSDEYSKNVSFLKLKTWFLHLETHFLCLETPFIQVLTLESRLSTYFWAVLKYSAVRDTMYEVTWRLIIIIKYSA